MTDKENVVYTSNGVLSSLKEKKKKTKQENFAIGNNNDEFRQYDNPVTGSQTLHDSIYMKVPRLVNVIKSESTMVATEMRGKRKCRVANQ